MIAYVKIRLSPTLTIVLQLQKNFATFVRRAYLPSRKAPGMPGLDSVTEYRDRGNRLYPLPREPGDYIQGNSRDPV